MGNVLILLESSSGKISKGSLAALSAARAIQKIWGKGKIVSLTLGAGASAAADQALTFGISDAYFSEKPEFEKFLASSYAQAIAECAKAAQADAVVGVAGTTGKDVFPRVAAILDAGQASDIVAVNSDGSLKRPMFAGDVFADVEITTALKVITVRSTAFAAALPEQGGGTKKELAVNLSGNLGEPVSFEASGGDRPELTEASIVVSGGRALKSSETFMQIMSPLADVLGAAIGASRAAVDSGYAPNDWQVGQTGKVVAPSLYVAVGISGAIQHLAGMKDSKTIAAINKDPEAPIFEVADYGLVADLFTAVPELVEEIKKAKG